MLSQLWSLVVSVGTTELSLSDPGRPCYPPWQGRDIWCFILKQASMSPPVYVIAPLIKFELAGCHYDNKFTCICSATTTRPINQSREEVSAQKKRWRSATGARAPPYGGATWTAWQAWWQQFPCGEVRLVSFRWAQDRELCNSDVTIISSTDFTLKMTRFYILL